MSKLPQIPTKRDQFAAWIKHWIENDILNMLTENDTTCGGHDPASLMNVLNEDRQPCHLYRSGLNLLSQIIAEQQDPCIDIYRLRNATDVMRREANHLLRLLAVRCIPYEG
jgi:hypothetical protein